MGDDRPQRQRIVRYFDCTWLSAWGEEQSRLSSLSPTGCYIESRFTVPEAGDVVPEIAVTLPTERIIVQGTVIKTTPGVGFAVRFTELDAATRDRLVALAHE